MPRSTKSPLDIAKDHLVAIYATECEPGETCTLRDGVAPSGNKGCVHAIAREGLEALGMTLGDRMAADIEWNQRGS